MLSEKIQTWLTKEGSYIDGLALLSTSGSTKVTSQLRNYLSFPLIPDHAYNSLTAALREYLLKHPVPLLVTASPAPTIALVDDSPVAPLRAQGRKQLMERDAARAQLRQMVDHQEKYTDGERYELANLIMAIQAEIDETYQRIEQYEQTGELPDQGTTYNIQQETIAKMNRMASLRSAISRLHSKLKNPNDIAHKQEMESDLLAKQVELQNLAQELNMED
jgi:hypothetical protein